MTNPIPEGYHAITPYLCIKGAAGAIEFYKRALGATETMRMPHPDGRVAHAELKIGTAIIMLADEFPEMGVVSPKTLGGTPVTLHMYVQDVDTLVTKATAEGLKVLRPVQDQFYGDRGGKFEDPYGHHWWIATHKEDVAPEEMAKRAAAATSPQ
jgi:PhnB protein